MSQTPQSRDDPGRRCGGVLKNATRDSLLIPTDTTNKDFRDQLKYDEIGGMTKRTYQ
jgi:hypothetical protein